MQYVSFSEVVAIERRHTHKRLVAVDAVVDDLSRRALVNSVMKFVLHGSEERAHHRGFRIIVDGRRINVRYLLIEVAFARTNIANPLQQLAEIAAATVLEPAIIERETFDSVLLENARSPLPKTNALLGLHAITYRDDDIEVVVLDQTLNLAPSLDLNCCKICNS